MVWLFVCFSAPAVGSWAQPGEWYAPLQKPSWNPPGWIFGPVWSVLYALKHEVRSDGSGQLLEATTRHP